MINFSVGNKKYKLSNMIDIVKDIEILSKDANNNRKDPKYYDPSQQLRIKVYDIQAKNETSQEALNCFNDVEAHYLDRKVA